MSPISFVILALLASNCYSSDVDSSEVNLVDLDEKALYVIIKQLNFTDTLNVAKTHPTLSDVANDVFRDKKSAYELQISGHSIFSRPMRDYNFNLSGPIHVNNFPLTLNILKHFGRSIGKIVIDYQYFFVPERKTITKFLREYTSKSVKQLELNSVDRNVLNEFTLPFKALEQLSITYDAVRAGLSRRWNKLFPQLQRLSVHVYSKSGFSLIDCEFPHLKHLSLHVDKIAWNKTNHIEELIEKNPTVERFQLGGYYTPELMKHVIEHLPHIEHLALYSWNIGNDSIQFTNVKDLIVRTSNAQTIDKVKLPQLDALEMSYFPDHTEKWIEFFNGHAQLTRLRIVESFTSHALPLNEFTANLPNLIDVTLLYTTEISIDNIITFIDNHKNLQKLRIAHQILSSKFQANAKTLRDRYSKDWTITDIGRIGNLGLMFQKNSAAKSGEK